MLHYTAFHAILQCAKITNNCHGVSWENLNAAPKLMYIFSVHSFPSYSVWYRDTFQSGGVWKKNNQLSFYPHEGDPAACPVSLIWRDGCCLFSANACCDFVGAMRLHILSHLKSHPLRTTEFSTFPHSPSLCSNTHKFATCHFFLDFHLRWIWNL